MQRFSTNLNKLNGKRAMSFVGRTYARIQHYLKRAKMNLDAVCIVTKETAVCIYMDGILLLQAVKNTMAMEWDISLTNKLVNILEMEKVAVL